MNIVFIGSDSALSLIPLRALIESRHNVRALVYDSEFKPQNEFNVTMSGSIQSLALNNSIPVIQLNEIQQYMPDVILVSCYAQRIPESIALLAKKGCFNIHPSLLPKFRGPVPLFWQFRQGVHDFGITIHRVTVEFDVGNIIAQQSTYMPDGIHINDATDLLANLAGELMLKTFDKIECINELTQNNKLASYESFPVESDYSVNTSWEAKRIFNFINAYKGSGVSFSCEVDGEIFKLIDAYSYQEKPYASMNGKATLLENHKLKFACVDSYVCCEISH